MSDENVVVEGEEEGGVDTAYEEPLPGGTDQGPYTGMSMDIPEEPFNPVAGLTPTEVRDQILENQNAVATGQLEDVDDDDVVVEDDENP